MTDEKQNLEQHVDELTRQVEELSRKLSQLAPADQQKPAPKSSLPPSELLPQPEISEELLSWAGEASLLPRLSTLCFLLVVALVLRTVTDHKLINMVTGSFLGMGYAATLIIAGWVLYGRGNRLAPVFSACGGVLMSLIVVETHNRFGALPTEPAYGLLAATGVTLAITSRKFNAITPISLGTLGMCLASATIDYPRPFFPYPAAVLLTANLLGYIAAGIRKCSWLRWIILFVSLVVLHLWAMVLGLSLERHQEIPAALAASWFLPVLSIFGIAYPAIAFLGIQRSGTERVSRFDFLLPTVSAIWMFIAANQFLSAGGEGKGALGAVGIAAAAIHLVVAYRLFLRRIPGAPGTNAFVFATAALLALSLPAAAGKPLFILPLLSLAALGLALVARQWQSGGIRVTSYLLQLYACGYLVAVLAPNSAISFSVVGAVSAAALVVVSFIHYRWSRRNPPPEGSTYFSRFDGRDRSAGALFISSLVAAFFMTRVGLYQGLALFPDGTGELFRSAQTVLINASALCLMLWALRQRNREIRNVAILVTVIGAIKVFMYDLIGLHGVPAVLSVFSFGIAAAVESAVLGRWQKVSVVTPPAESA